MGWRNKVLLVAAMALAACSASTADEGGENEPEVSDEDFGYPSAGGKADELAGLDVGMNDVSILFPLPEVGKLDQLLSASSRGANGSLLPLSKFEKAPLLTTAKSVKKEHWADLRVVAARLDPCFPSLDAAVCKAQVRLVMQPIYEQDGQVIAEDAAIHVFYKLSKTAFRDLTKELLAARDAAAPIPRDAELGVHPTLLAEGLDGAYATAIKQALLRSIGSKYLTRFTFMQLSGRRNLWVFGGFDFTATTTKKMDIIGSGVTEQSFQNSSFNADFQGAINPEIESAPEDLTALLYSYEAREKSEAELWALYESALRVENPDKHNPDTVDCVTCHVEQPVRLWLEQNYDFRNRESDERFVSELPLTETAVEKTPAMLRAFGWFVDKPAISQRVVNETAAITAYLRR